MMLVQRYSRIQNYYLYTSPYLFTPKSLSCGTFCCNICAYSAICIFFLHFIR
nr:MAG TPA: hypothetical protein [Caudoviricetes sp.]